MIINFESADWQKLVYIEDFDEESWAVLRKDFILNSFSSKWKDIAAVLFSEPVVSCAESPAE